MALLLFGVLFLGVSDTQLVAPLLPLIARDFQITPGHAGMIVTTYSFAAAIFALVIGPVSDRLGRKKVLTFGLLLFGVAAVLTFYISSFNSLLIVRMLTGLSAGTLSTCSLSYAADHYAYSERGRAMGVLSMAYFAAFVFGVPAGAFAAARFGWQSVFAGFALAAGAVFILVLTLLPADTARSVSPYSLNSLASHFFKTDRSAGIVAAFLTSGGIVGFLTYVGAWLTNDHGIGVERVGFIFVASGAAAIVASPLSGWLADYAGKRAVIVWANLGLSILFVIVARLEWGALLIAAIAALSIAASARQAPLHALTTELVGPEIRGEYIAVRNAASQLGIGLVAFASAWAFDKGGFIMVSYLAAVITLLIPLSCLGLREPPVYPVNHAGQSHPTVHGSRTTLQEGHDRPGKDRGPGRDDGGHAEAQRDGKASG